MRIGFVLMAGQVVVLTGLSLLTGDAAFVLLSLGLSFGFPLWTWVGGRVKEEIISSVYGNDWRVDATLGRLVREKSEEARSN